MADVFISYRHVSPDQDLADEMAKFLQCRGVSCFLDKEIPIGQNWVQTIESELRVCQSFAAILSSESIRSDMVRQEVKLAHEWGKRILPIRVNYDGAFPYDLAAYLDLIQYKIWQTGQPFKPICEAVLDGIRGNWTQRGLEPSPGALRRLGELTELNGAPLPSADPRLPISAPETGGLKLQSKFYVRRADDNMVEDLVRGSGETILIKGPRQVGKTSLAARACARAEQNKQRVCYIDFQLLDQSRLSAPGVLCRYIASRLAKDLRTTIKPTDVWDETLGDADSLTDFIEQVLSATASPVVLCLDEVDNVFACSYRDNFFGMLRGWHNRRATRDVWNQFNLLVVHSTEPALFIKDLNQSPFNVGTVIRLSDFDGDEVKWLNHRHGSPLKTDQDLELFLQLVGGYPYLVRQALYALCSRPMSMADLVAVAARDDGPFGDHLRRHLWVLRDNVRLRKALKQIVTGRECDDEDAFQRLHSAGLILGETREAAKPRCGLYTQYMRNHL